MFEISRVGPPRSSAPSSEAPVEIDGKPLRKTKREIVKNGGFPGVKDMRIELEPESCGGASDPAAILALSQETGGGDSSTFDALEVLAEKLESTNTQNLQRAA